MVALAKNTLGHERGFLPRMHIFKVIHLQFTMHIFTVIHLQNL